VVSVGNLAAGGTGKTPVVDWLLRWAAARGITAAVVSRGYGGRPGPEPLLVADGSRLLVDDPARCGDEPLLLARRNPAAVVVVAPRRAAGVRLAEQRGARLIVLDDGFQHLAVARDLDIVLLDSRRPFGNHLLLPAGILREPPAHLERADLVICTRAGDGAAPELNFSGPLLQARHVLDEVATALDGTTVLLGELAGRAALPFAGIAEPAAFFGALRERGITPVAELPLADHQHYSPAVCRLIEECGAGAEFYLTTEKDAVKLRGTVLARPCYVVSMALAFTPPEILDKHLLDLLTRSAAS
jgi:tetraacyldisaccharide 4'-kinase